VSDRDAHAGRVLAAQVAETADHQAARDQPTRRPGSGRGVPHAAGLEHPDESASTARPTTRRPSKNACRVSTLVLKRASRIATQACRRSRQPAESSRDSRIRRSGPHPTGTPRRLAPGEGHIREAVELRTEVARYWSSAQCGRRDRPDMAMKIAMPARSKLPSVQPRSRRNRNRTAVVNRLAAVHTAAARTRSIAPVAGDSVVMDGATWRV